MKVTVIPSFIALFFPQVNVETFDKVMKKVSNIKDSHLSFEALFLTLVEVVNCSVQRGVPTGVVL